MRPRQRAVAVYRLAPRIQFEMTESPTSRCRRSGFCYYLSSMRSIFTSDPYATDEFERYFMYLIIYCELKFSFFNNVVDNNKSVSVRKKKKHEFLVKSCSYFFFLKKKLIAFSNSLLYYTSLCVRSIERICI